jgi:sugar lactone lactonase YvrE
MFYSHHRRSYLFPTFSIFLVAFIAGVLWRTSVYSEARIQTHGTTELLAIVDPPSESIKIISVQANDIAYNPADDTIYAAIPSSAGATGNSIQPINPRTGAVGSSVFIGSEPVKLAAANDGQTLYVSLDGAYAVREFNMITHTPGDQFSLGIDPLFNQRYKLSDMMVSPADPNSLAVARRRPNTSPPQGGVAIFNSGVPLPVTVPAQSGSDWLAFSSVASTIFGSGSSGGLKTMQIEANGVSVSQTSSLAPGARIKFANGVVYTSAGEAIDPSTQSILGTFASSASIAFVPDAAVGRAYYLVKDSLVAGNWILKAFDLNTFGFIGSFNIPNVSGDATTLIRWGGNGLAFRTTTNRVYVVQTNLIPSGDPIPTPTVTTSPTATATPFTTSFRTMPVNGNDLAYSSLTQKLYVSIPSSAGVNGNSIGVVDPVTETLENSVFIGSEPNKVVMTADGQSLYAALDGARSIRRFDVNTLTPGIQFPAGISLGDGALKVRDFDVARDNPNTLAVSRCSASSSPCDFATAVFDNGIMRPQTDGAHTQTGLTFSDSSAALYGGSTDGGLDVITVNGNGIGNIVHSPFASALGLGIKFHQGFVYGPTGQVINTQTLQIQGTFTAGSATPLKFLIDAAHGRIFFLQTSPTYKIAAFELNTFLPIGTIDLPPGGGTNMVRWGSNGIAVTRGSAGLLLVQSNLIDPLAPVPSFTPTETPSATSTATPYPQSTRSVNLIANDVVYDPQDGYLYASVPATGQNGTANSITRIDPETGSILSSVPVGIEPGKLALSDDGGSLYVALGQQRNAVRRYNIPSQMPGLQFATQIASPIRDMAVRPGHPDSLVVGTGVDGAAIYDNGVKRPNIPMNFGSIAKIGLVKFLGSPDLLFGYNNYDTGNDLFRVSVDPNGLNTVSSIGRLITGFSTVIEAADGKLFTAHGPVVDPFTNTMVGTFLVPSTWKSIAVDATLRRVYISSYFPSRIDVFDMDSFLNIATIPVFADGVPEKMVRWGQNGLAVRIVDGVNNPLGIYLIESSLIAPVGISGTVTYGNAIGASTPRFVSNVLLSGAGSVPVSASSLTDGTYTLNGFGSGAYTVTPSKTGGVNGSITSFDAGRIAQHVAGVNTLTGTQLIVADVSGNGSVSSFDAGQLARYVAAVPGSGATGNWIFNPANRMYASITGSVSGEDYFALLMGEVSGNWIPGAARPVGSRHSAVDGGPERSMEVGLPTLSAALDKEVVIPVSVGRVAGKGIISYEFDLRYDPSVLQPSAEPVETGRTASRALSVVTNAGEPGLLRVCRLWGGADR